MAAPRAMSSQRCSETAGGLFGCNPAVTSGGLDRREAAMRVLTELRRGNARNVGDINGQMDDGWKVRRWNKRNRVAESRKREGGGWVWCRCPGALVPPFEAVRGGLAN